MHQIRRRCLHGQSQLTKPIPSKPHIPSSPTKPATRVVVIEKKNNNITFIEDSKHAKRNSLGVQLLSRTLHHQLFPSTTTTTPAPTGSYIQISREHLQTHGLDPTLASSLSSVSFPLPNLQGRSIAEHFHRIGEFTSFPYRSFALELAKARLLPVPEISEWDVARSGWTRYTWKKGGAGWCEAVPYPMHENENKGQGRGEEEEMLVFDVETMPSEGHQYPVIAIAASPNAWYAWISPWLLGESEQVEHLIPLGPDTKKSHKTTSKPKLVVGHNVSFDRARVKDEYVFPHPNNNDNDDGGNKTRWLDTMSLHVAVNGISSHQRPAWQKWKKGKRKEREMRDEAEQVVRELIQKVKEEEERLGKADGEEEDDDGVEKLEKLIKLRSDMEESLDGGYVVQVEEETDAEEEKRWESLTSANSLVDVARLHCNIDFEDEKMSTRNRLLQITRKELMSTDSQHLSLADLLTYCAQDVLITHRIFQSVLPSFLIRCPHPVSFSGMLTMGSSFLTVNQEWEKYIQNAENVYSTMQQSVKTRLAQLANENMKLALVKSAVKNGRTEDVVWDDEGRKVWEDDPWLSQLDWTPKKVGKSRGVGVGVVSEAVETKSLDEIEDEKDQADDQARDSSEYTDYSLQDREHIPGKLYSDLALEHLCQSFPYASTKEVKHQFNEHNSLYAPTHVFFAQQYKFQNQSPRESSSRRRNSLSSKLEPSRASLDPEFENERNWVEAYDALSGDLDRVREWFVSGRNFEQHEDEFQPKWYQTLVSSGPLSPTSLSRILPLLLNLSYNGHPLHYSTQDGWHYHDQSTGSVVGLPTSAKSRTTTVLGPKCAKVLLDSGEMQTGDKNHGERYELAVMLSRSTVGKLFESTIGEEVVKWRVMGLAKQVLKQGKERLEEVLNDPWLSQLDWSSSKKGSKSKSAKETPPTVYWPKWYWDLTKPKKGLEPGTIDLSSRNRIAPLLLRLAWRRYPLYFSREHGWCYRVPGRSGDDNRRTDNKGTSLKISHPADNLLADLNLYHGFSFYKLPHKDGESANVGSPLGKTFVQYAANGTLTSPGGEAKEALELNAVCSYWISSRDRIMNQMVVWDKEYQGSEQKWGMILPQVIAMGTVTRRAIEKTWLTASNAKKNRVGSELKAMVRAPPGYAIVGADVDSEELWISSCMGDAQFGMHGATALGWMTLEGTKSAGTDLHSKTAKILGLSRDQAKVFNYSRIYGAGMKHAVLLLLQANAGMSVDQARKLAENLYASTKGKNTHRTDVFERKFWFGGSESFVFNKLEEIANSEQPKTPALGCGVTYALSREYLPNQFGSDYMPSRINWVVQSSGVDYLHMLIVSMDYLIARYGIQARYLISVHDELRYLVAERDKYRAALALQIANLWTRAMFAYMLGMDDLPQGVAFFSAVDVDTCLRKEVDMECVTPSQPVPIPPGESLGIEGVLEKTGGSLGPVLPVRGVSSAEGLVGSLDGYQKPDCLVHRSKSAAFLRAQATQDFGEVKGLAQQVYGVKFEGGIGGGGSAGRKVKSQKGNKGRTSLAPLGNGEDIDWSDAVEELLRDESAVKGMSDRVHY